MIKGIYSGVSGMKAFQEAIGVTSNNIANAQTIGYKSKKAYFEDLLYQSTAAKRGNGGFAGTNPLSIGNGVRMSATKTNLDQGSITYTGGKTDVGIEGNGYFILGNNEGTELEYTRKGSFELSEDNRLVTENGQYVLGWNRNATTGDIDTFAAPQPIHIQLNAAMKGEATTNGKITGNLDFNLAVGESTRIQFPAFDNAGNRTDVEVEMVKTANDEYRYVVVPNQSFVESDSIKNVFLNTKNVATLPDFEKGEYTIEVVGPATPGGQSTINVYKPSDTGRTTPIISQLVDNVEQPITLKDAAGNEWMTVDYHKIAEGTPVTTNQANFTIGDVGDIAFGVNGLVDSVTPLGYAGGPVQFSPEVEYVSATTGQSNSFALDFNLLTNYSTNTSIGVAEIDGSPAASVRDFALSDDGMVLAQYSDGSVLVVGQIAMATFANSQGLVPVGSGNFVESANSGMANVTTSGAAGSGTIRSQSLENSNVDLSNEFVDLMMFQKAFQANTKIIQISDEVVSGVINLIR